MLTNSQSSDKTANNFEFSEIKDDETKTHEILPDETFSERSQWDPGLTEISAASFLCEMGEIFTNVGRLHSDGREKVRDFYRRGIDKFLNIKPTELIQHLNLDEVSERHAKRIIKAALTELEIGLAVNTLLESHSRQLDKLESPEDKRLAYEMAVQCASGERLTAKNFEQAVEQVLAVNLAKLNAANDDTHNRPHLAKAEEVNNRYTAIKLFESISKCSSSKKADFFKGVLQSSKDVHPVLRLLMSDKLEDEEKKALVVMLENWS